MTTGPILCAVFLGPRHFRMQFPGDSFKLCQQILEIPTFVSSRKGKLWGNCMQLWGGESASAYQWRGCVPHEPEDAFAGGSSPQMKPMTPLLPRVIVE